MEIFVFLAENWKGTSSFFSVENLREISSSYHDWIYCGFFFSLEVMILS